MSRDRNKSARRAALRNANKSHADSTVVSAIAGSAAMLTENLRDAVVVKAAYAGKQARQSGETVRDIVRSRPLLALAMAGATAGALTWIKTSNGRGLSD